MSVIDIAKQFSKSYKKKWHMAYKKTLAAAQRHLQVYFNISFYMPEF